MGRGMSSPVAAGKGLGKREPLRLCDKLLCELCDRCSVLSVANSWSARPYVVRTIDEVETAAFAARTRTSYQQPRQKNSPIDLTAGPDMT